MKENQKLRTACDEFKLLSEFYVNKRTPSGFSGRCKKCIRKYQLEYYAKNIERCRATNVRWAQNNRERLSKYSKEYWLTRRARRNEISRKSKEKLKKENPEKFRAYLRKRNKRIRLTVRGSLDHRMSTAIRKGLKSKKTGKTWRDFVPYTLKQLLLRLKRTMPDGYTWDDFLVGKLHIDHIIPRSVFKYSSPDDLNFQRAWALSNLQLLPVEENLKKGARIDDQFQSLFSFI